MGGSFNLERIKLRVIVIFKYLVVFFLGGSVIFVGFKGRIRIEGWKFEGY